MSLHFTERKPDRCRIKQCGPRISIESCKSYQWSYFCFNPSIFLYCIISHSICTRNCCVFCFVVVMLWILVFSYYIYMPISFRVDFTKSPLQSIHYIVCTISRVSCQKGPTRHAYAWQIGPFWQDTLDVWTLFIVFLLRTLWRLNRQEFPMNFKSFACLTMPFESISVFIDKHVCAYSDILNN